MGAADPRAGRGGLAWESAAAAPRWPGRAEAGERWGAVEFPVLVGPRALALPPRGSAFPEEPQPPPGFRTENLRDQDGGADSQY